jgi:excinuclease ABC subunit C
MDNLIKSIRSLPDSPGVYQFFDENGKILYIGKAKSLKKRVKSYFGFEPSLHPAKNLSLRIKNMIRKTESLSYIVVESEHDALILENSLIKQLKPRYNILLRDDKTYPYIFVDLDEEYPRFRITRKIREGKNLRYFGPFTTAAKEILQAIYELHPLVQREGDIKSKKLCLFYQIKRCLGPCEKDVDKTEYMRIVKSSIELIKDKNSLIKILTQKMEELSSRLLFEEASKYRDMIIKIKNSALISDIDLAKLEDFDIFSIYMEKSIACGVKIFIREGKVISSSHSIFRSDNGFDKSELYKRLLLGFYKNDVIAVKKILVDEDFDEREEIERFLEKRFDKSVSISVPKRGFKKRLTNLAKTNAKEILQKSSTKEIDILKEIKELFNLNSTPYTIEGFDNSHIGGEARVGAVIKWDGEFKKDEYRHYNLTAKDEYGQMRELLRRRVESFSKNPPPDLFVIDGGKALLDLAIDILREVKVDTDVVAIAKEKVDFKANRSKGRANDIIWTKDGSIKLKSGDKRLHFIQKIRDEAHRFAINYHKRVKLKEDKKISLLKIKGVGEGSIKKLLNYFQTFENIEQASFEELKNIVGTNIASKIKNN